MELATLNFDTYEIVKQLQARGYTEEQASGFVDAMQKIKLSGAATKQDTHNIQDEIQELRNEITQIKSVMVTQQDIHQMMRFQIIQTVTIIGVMVALLSFFG